MESTVQKTQITTKYFKYRPIPKKLSKSKFSFRGSNVEAEARPRQKARGQREDEVEVAKKLLLGLKAIASRTRIFVGYLLAQLYPKF